MVDALIKKIIVKSKTEIEIEFYYKDEFDNLTFETWEPDLTSDITLMLGMQSKLRDFIEKEIDYNIDVGIRI